MPVPVTSPVVVIDSAPLPKLAALMPSAPPLTPAAWMVRSVPLALNARMPPL